MAGNPALYLDGETDWHPNHPALGIMRRDTGIALLVGEEIATCHLFGALPSRARLYGAGKDATQHHLRRNRTGS
jgi:hypothetical protein